MTKAQTIFSARILQCKALECPAMCITGRIEANVYSYMFVEGVT